MTTDVRIRPALADAALRLPRSGIREIMERATGPDVIHLEVGEPDFATPAHIVEAAAAAAREGQTKYTSARGTAVLRDAIVARLERDRGMAVTPESVMVTPGGGTALLLAYLGIVDPGDEVLIPDPGWPNTESQVLLAGGVPVRYPLRRERGFEPDLDVLEGLLGRPNVRALYLNSPGNPTGAVIDGETVAAIVALCARHGRWVVSDECYEEIRFGVPLASPLHSGWERTIGAFSLSKTYAMTGWRVGYLVAPPELIEVTAKTGEVVVSCASAISQAAAEAALSGPQDAVSEMVASYRRRRDLVVPLLRDAGLLAAVPQGAFYTLVDVTSSGMSSRAFALDLLEHTRVATAPGDTFGPHAEGFVRISLATREDLLVQGVRRLVEHVRSIAAGGSSS
jgi:aspartate/methionine/tyrosine aminotransferase